MRIALIVAATLLAAGSAAPAFADVAVIRGADLTYTPAGGPPAVSGPSLPRATREASGPTIVMRGKEAAAPAAIAAEPPPLYESSAPPPVREAGSRTTARRGAGERETVATTQAPPALYGSSTPRRLRAAGGTTVMRGTAQTTTSTTTVVRGSPETAEPQALAGSSMPRFGYPATRYAPADNLGRDADGPIAAPPCLFTEPPTCR